MIKKLILPVLALLAITSCSSDELLQESPNPSGQPYISFNTLINNNTRAEATVQNIKDNGFSVHAYFNDGSEYFGVKHATYKEDLQSFWMDTDYYWPGENSELTFTAWYPSSIDQQMSIGGSGSSKHYSQHDFAITPDYLGINGTDILIASSKAKHGSYWTQSHPLTFHHMFAQILVQAKNEATNYDVEISNVALRYISAWGDYSGRFIPNSVTDISTSSDLTQSDINLKTTPMIKSGGTAYVNDFDKTSDKKEDIVHAFFLHAEDAEGNQPTSISKTEFSTLVGDANLQNGFYVMRQVFDVEDPNNSLNPVAESWYGDKGANGAYLGIKAKITQHNGTVIHDGWIAIPAFYNLSIYAGHRYIFKLTFTNTGAGQYPPEDDEKGGQPIIGDPIHFTVKDITWTENNVSDIEMGNTTGE